MEHGELDAIGTQERSTVQGMDDKNARDSSSKETRYEEKTDDASDRGEEFHHQWATPHTDCPADPIDYNPPARTTRILA